MNTTHHDLRRDNRSHIFSPLKYSPSATFFGGGREGRGSLLQNVFLCRILRAAVVPASLGRWAAGLGGSVICCAVPQAKAPGARRPTGARGRSPGGSQHRHVAEPLGLQLSGQPMGQLRRNEAGLLHWATAAHSEILTWSGTSPSNNQMQKTGA